MRLSIDSPRLTGLYIEKLLQIAEEQGVRDVEAFAGLEVPRDQLFDPNRRFTYREFYRLAEALETSAGIAGLGLLLGRREGPLSEGFVGYACISAPTLRRAIEVYARYSGYLGLDLQVTLEVEAERASLSFREIYPLGRHLRFSIEELIGHWLSIGEQLRGGRLVCASVDLSYPAPGHAFMYSDQLRCPLNFDQGANRLWFDRDFLDSPFVASNDTVHRLCVSHCETLYERMARTGKLSAEIERIIVDMPSSPPTLGELAEQFNMTPRTLRRHLKEEGTSFQALLSEVRMSLAGLYLRNTAATPAEIARWVGYQEVASFYRNFKRWAGQTPQQYRQQNDDA